MNLGKEKYTTSIEKRLSQLGISDPVQPPVGDAPKYNTSIEKRLSQLGISDPVQPPVEDTDIPDKVGDPKDSFLKRMSKNVAFGALASFDGIVDFARILTQSRDNFSKKIESRINSEILDSFGKEGLEQHLKTTNPSKEKRKKSEETRKKAFENLNSVIQAAMQKTAVKDANLLDKIVQGAGSTIPTMIPGLGVVKAAKAMSSSVVVATILGQGTDAVLESAAEAGGTYNNAIAMGKSEKEATKDAYEVFFATIPVNYILNNWIFNEIPQGKEITNILKGAGQEAGQEAVQQVISNVALNDSLFDVKNLEGVPESAIIGGTIGGAFQGVRAAKNVAKNLTDSDTFTPKTKTRSSDVLDSILNDMLGGKTPKIDKPKGVNDIDLSEDQDVFQSEEYSMEFKPDPKPEVGNLPKNLNQKLSSLTKKLSLRKNKSLIEDDTIIDLPEILEISKSLLDKTPSVLPEEKMINNALGVFIHGRKPPAIILNAITAKGNLIDRHEFSTKEEVDEFIKESKKLDSSTKMIFDVRFDRKNKEYVVSIYDGDYRKVAKVLAHEIGHLVDYIPNKKISRKSLLEKVSKIKSHILNMDKDGFAAKTNKEITEELKELTINWNFFDTKKVSKDYLDYRFSSAELYADYVSVLFNDPSLAKEIAPTFTKLFEESISTKPEFKKIYQQVLERTQSDQEFSDLRNRVRDMFAVGDATKLENEKAIKNKKSKKGFLVQVKKLFVDKNAYLISLVKDSKKKGFNIPVHQNPLYAVEEMNYIQSEVYSIFQVIQEDVITPLEQNGLTEKDVGEYMLYQRSQTEREYYINPLGITKPRAMKQLRKMREDLGEKKFEVLEIAVSNFFEIRKERVITPLHKSGAFSEKLMWHISDNKNYAFFKPIKYLESRFGAKGLGQIYKQIGTFEDIVNPFYATILKDASLIRTAHRTITAQKIVKYLKSISKYDPSRSGEIYEAEKDRSPGNNGFLEPHQIKQTKKYPKDFNPREYGLITFMSGGVQEGYYVDIDIADIFKSNPMEANVIMNTFMNFSSIIKQVLVNKNPTWMARNVLRDFRSLWLNVPESDIPKIFSNFFKVFPEVFNDVFLKKVSPLINEMYQNKALIAGRVYTGMEYSDSDTALTQLFETYDLSIKNDPNKEKKWSKILNIANMFELAHNFLDNLGEMSEKLPRATAYQILKKHSNLTQQEISQITRSVAGPNFLAGGKYRIFLNNIFLFSNANVQGIRSSFMAASRNKSKFISRFTIRTASGSMTNNIVLALVAAGFFGAAAKDWVDNISDHDKANYDIIPLGKTSNGKSIYLKIPLSHTEQFLSNIFWAAINGLDRKTLEKTLKTMYGASPYTSLNPLLEVPSQWIQFGMGRNPYDSFRGRTVVPEYIFDAGMMASLPHMTKSTWDSFGGRMIYNFPNYTSSENLSPLEDFMKIPVMGGLLNSFVEVSDWGVVTKAMNTVKEVRQKKAADSLKVIAEIKGNVKKTSPDQIPSQITKLYLELMKKGLIGKETEDFKRFKNKYIDEALLFHSDNPTLTKVIQSTRTSDEFLAILKIEKEIEKKIKLIEEYLRLKAAKK